MSSIIDLKCGFNDICLELSNIFMYFKYFVQHENFQFNFDNINLNEIINSIFWIFLFFSFGFFLFCQLFDIFLRTSKIKYYKRKQFSRSIWNIAFFGASAMFLYQYHELMISPQLSKNTGSLFPTYDNTIFYLGNSCERFKKLYALIIITFYLHAAMLDFKEADYCEAVTKTLYSFAIISLVGYRFENYFVILNLNQGIFNIITECLFLLALQTSNKSQLKLQVFLGMRIASWSHIFISLLPFKYLIPTLFSKNFKFLLNAFIWLWYGLSIWNSPVLQYFSHQTYHNTATDCAGEGSAAKCILLKDSTEHRHFKVLRKGYLELKLEKEKLQAGFKTGPTNESTTAKTAQAIKFIMTMKRKIRRMRESHESSDVATSSPLLIETGA